MKVPGYITFSNKGATVHVDTSAPLFWHDLMARYPEHAARIDELWQRLRAENGWD